MKTTSFGIQHFPACSTAYSAIHVRVQPHPQRKKNIIYSYIKRDSAHVKLYNDKLVSFLFGFVFVSGYDKWGPMRSSGRDSRDLDARDRQDIYYAHDMSTCTQPVAVVSRYQ